MSEKIKVFALGGLDEEGRDCYVLEINDDIFVLDCGMSLPDKTIPGIDSLLPNCDYLIQNKNRLKAYIITHGHDEVMGAIKYIYKEAPAPIYCTESTAKYMVAQANLYRVKVLLNFKVVKPSSEAIIAGRKFRFFQTCHNMSYAFGVAIQTDRGNIVYTSDFIVDYTVKDEAFRFDLKSLAKLAEEETFLLMSESKCASLDGYCAPHHRVTGRLEKLFKTNKRIFISCFWENVFRIYEIFNLAKLYRRKVFFYDDYTQNVISFMIEAKVIDIDKSIVVNNEDLLRVKKSELVILMLGHGNDIFNEMTDISFGRNDDKRISLNEEDIYIVASIPTETFEVLATRSIDNLYRTGAQVVWLKRKDVPAMHARKDDLKFFLSLLRPKYYLPVRGFYNNMIDNAKLALEMGIGLNHMSVFILDNGMQLVFDEKPRPTVVPNSVNGIKISPVLVDGTGISTVGDEVIEDRKKLGIDGVVMVAATVSMSKKCIIAGPDCQMRGFVFVKEAEPLLKTVIQIYIEEVNKSFEEEEYPNFKLAEMTIKERARRFIKKENGREPLIIASVVTTD